MVVDTAPDKRQHAGSKHRGHLRPRSADQHGKPPCTQGVGQLLRVCVEVTPGTTRFG